MTDTLTIAEKLKEAGFSEIQAAALTRAIETAATAKAELVEARMNKDLAAVIERSDAKLDAVIERSDAKLDAAIERSNAAIERSNAAIERTIREQTRWYATIVFSAIGVLVAFLGLVLHFR